MTREDVLKLLQQLDGRLPDSLSTGVTERIVLKKFSCDGPSDRTDEPLETIVIENGVVIENAVI